MSKITVYTNESVNVAISEGLQRRGVEALSSRDAGNLGLTDEEQLDFANERHMAIFTHDTDFLRISTTVLAPEDMINHIEFL